MDNEDWAQMRAELNAVRDRSYDALRRIEVHEATCSVRYLALAKKLDLLMWVVVCVSGFAILAQGVGGVSSLFNIFSKIVPLL